MNIKRSCLLSYKYIKYINCLTWHTVYRRALLNWVILIIHNYALHAQQAYGKNRQSPDHILFPNDLYIQKSAYGTSSCHDPQIKFYQLHQHCQFRTLGSTKKQRRRADVIKCYTSESSRTQIVLIWHEIWMIQLWGSLKLVFCMTLICLKRFLYHQ